MKAPASSRRPGTSTILLVEDDVRDVRILREAIREAAIDAEIQIAPNGDEALRMLRRLPPYQGLACPDLVLLDLNLPLKNGREVLAEIRTDAALRLLPVVILTTSTHADDVVACYGLHANGYLAKPIDFAEFTRMVRSLHEYWCCQTVLLPKPDGSSGAGACKSFHGA